MKHWFIQLFIACDQLLNVLITPFSAGAWADETLSSRAFRMHGEGKPWGRFWMPVIDWLFSWQTPEHCRYSFEEERKRLQVPPELRTP